MDQEWKKQNQLADTQTQSPQSTQTVPTAVTEAALPTASPGQAAAPQPKSAPPDTLAGQTGTNVYDQYNPGVVPKRKIVVTVIVLALLAIPGGIGAYAFLGKNPPQKVDNQTPAVNTTKPQPNTTQPVLENKQPAIPISWKVVDTKLGYTVKIPADWSGDTIAPTESDFGIYKSTTLTLGAIAAPESAAIPYGKYISTGIESITTSKSQADFEKAVTDVDTFAQAFSLDKSKVKVTLSKLNISGKQWTQVDAEIPDQVSRTLYLWVDDHAIFMSISKDKNESLDKLSNDYLFPIAGSLQIK